MRARRSPTAVVAAVCAVLASATHARCASAEPTDAERATARRLLFEGRKKLLEGDAGAALRDLRPADAIMGVPTTALDHARAAIEVGLLVEASEALYRAVRFSGRAPLPGPYVAAQADAKRLLDALTPRIPVLRIRVRVQGAEAATPSDDVQVSLDDRPVAAGVLDVPLTVDPGEHRVALEDHGKRVAVERVELHEGDVRTIDLVLPADAPPSPEAAASSSAPRPSVAPPASPRGLALAPPREGPLRRTIVITGLAVAGTGVVVGTVAGIVSAHATDTLRDTCPSHGCPSDAESTLHRAQTSATVANVAFAAAGAGLASAAVAWLWPSRAARPAHSAPPAALGFDGRVLRLHVAF